MELNYEFEEKEQYTPEDVQAILEGVKGQVDSLVLAKDETITGLTTELEGLEEIKTSSKELSIQNLMLKNNLDSDLFDLVADDDLEVVESRIEKLKSITKQKDIDGAFKPKDKKHESQYEKAISNKDVEGALKSKFGRLFG